MRKTRSKKSQKLSGALTNAERTENLFRGNENFLKFLNQTLKQGAFCPSPLV
jgi:hypothetical protein